MSAEDLDTRTALLRTAAEIFAEQGFGAARVRDIAARAGANLAAINYHFGSKEGLYVAVLEHEARQVIERHPITPADRPPTLRRVVAGLLGRFLALDARSYAPRLMVREMLSPTVALPQVVEHVLRPQFEQVFAVVCEHLGPKVPVEQARLCAFSVVGQCMFYLIGRPVVGQIAPQALAPEHFDALVEHVTALTAAGLEARRRQYEEKNRA
ncbi:MAG: CerR family C-terminal domain-containing protein [Gammaproteobacteria bacterium]